MKNAFVSFAAITVATVFALYTPYASAQARCGEATLVSNKDCGDGSFCSGWTNPINGGADNKYLTPPFSNCSICISPLYSQEGTCSDFYSATDKALLKLLEKNPELARRPLAVPSSCDGTIALLVPFEDRRHAM